MSQEEQKTPREIELEEDIEMQNFIMSRCISDSAFRRNQKRLDEFHKELREIRSARKEKEQQ